MESCYLMFWPPALGHRDYFSVSSTAFRLACAVFAVQCLASSISRTHSHIPKLCWLLSSTAIMSPTRERPLQITKPLPNLCLPFSPRRKIPATFYSVSSSSPSTQRQPGYQEPHSMLGREEGMKQQNKGEDLLSSSTDIMNLLIMNLHRDQAVSPLLQANTFEELLIGRFSFNESYP